MRTVIAHNVGELKEAIKGLDPSTPLGKQQRGKPEEKGTVCILLRDGVLYILTETY